MDKKLIEENVDFFAGCLYWGNFKKYKEELSPFIFKNVTYVPMDTVIIDWPSVWRDYDKYIEGKMK